jgi:hypothetical protein
MSEESKTDVFPLVAFAVSCASTIPGETLALASFRILDVAARLIALAEESGSFVTDPFLQTVRASFAAHMNDVMWNQDAFLAWVSELEAEFVREARRRDPAGSEPHTSA